MIKKETADYWDFTIFIPPSEIARMRADCGDTYNDDVDESSKQREPVKPVRDFSHYHTSYLYQLMIDENNDDGSVIEAWGAKPTLRVVEEWLEKGVTLVINSKGKTKLIAGDAMLENRKAEIERVWSKK